MTETLNIMQAAKLAGTSDKTIRRAIHAGKLAATFPQPNQAVIQLADFEAYLASRQRVQVSGPVQTVVQDVDLDTRVYASSLEHRIDELEMMVKQLGARVVLLERLVLRPAPVKPVNVTAFAAMHNVPEADYKRAMNIEALPVKTRKGGALLLDEEGQRAFYQLFRELPSFVACSDCPHGYV